MVSVIQRGESGDRRKAEDDENERAWWQRRAMATMMACSLCGHVCQSATELQMHLLQRHQNQSNYHSQMSRDDSRSNSPEVLKVAPKKDEKVDDIPVVSC